MQAIVASAERTAAADRAALPFDQDKRILVYPGMGEQDNLQYT